MSVSSNLHLREIKPLQACVLAPKVEGLERGRVSEGEDVSSGSVQVGSEDVERCQGTGVPNADCAIAWGELGRRSG